MAKRVLVSGASFAGLCTAIWLEKLGYDVTVVEVGKSLKKGGTPVNIEGDTIEVVRRMGLLERIVDNNITMEELEYKGADDVTRRAEPIQKTDGAPAEARYEIERNVLLDILFEAVSPKVEMIFGDSIAALHEDHDRVEVVFKSGQTSTFDIVIGCDGLHSGVRKLTHGDEARFSHFMGAYFSITIVDHYLIRENTTQLYNEPCKAVMLNAYNGKTDIVLCFASDTEIPYDYRNETQMRNIIRDQFAEVGWRTPELLEEMKGTDNFYFDKLCQIKLPEWSKGRIALVGDAAHCASPAAGRGGSLAIEGATALADALREHPDNPGLAFQAYERAFRPKIEQVQAEAVQFGADILVPKTAEAINARNAQPLSEADSD